MKYFSIVVLFFCFFSCESNQQKTEVELGDNKEIDIDIVTCNCDSLKLNKNNKLTFNNNVFTGICELNYPETEQKYIDKQIVEGEVLGKVSYYSKLGEFLYAEVYNKGKLKSDGQNIHNCNCSELTIKTEDGVNKNYLQNNLFTGTCEDFYPNSKQVYIESTYKNGLLDGYTTYFNKNGSTIYMQKYKVGQLLKEIYPSNDN